MADQDLDPAARLAELEAALRPFADFARTIATERAGWDQDAFPLFWADAHGGLRELRLALAPFRAAARLLPPSDTGA